MRYVIKYKVLQDKRTQSTVRATSEMKKMNHAKPTRGQQSHREKSLKDNILGKTPVRRLS